MINHTFLWCACFSNSMDLLYHCAIAQYMYVSDMQGVVISIPAEPGSNLDI
jgi:hypothetical protein